MSREYKFRAWDGKEFLPLTREVAFIDDDGVLCSRVEGIIFSQFTGLTDRLGKDIWEGDIVLVYGEYRLIEFKHAFWYLAGQETMREQSVLGGFGTMHDEQFKPLYRYDECEVVGNIYENSDLLK